MTLSTAINYGPAARGLINPGARMGGVTQPIIAYASGIYTITMFQIGATFQWQRDGGAGVWDNIAGQTGQTKAEVSADDNSWVRVAMTFGGITYYSNEVLQGFDGVIYSNNFDAVADGTALRLMAGWAATAASNHFVIAGGDVTQPANGTGNKTYYDTGSNDHAVVWTVSRNAGDEANGNTNTIRHMLANLSDTSNYTRLIIQNNGWSLDHVGTGAATLQAFTSSGLPAAPNCYVTGDQFTLRILGGKAYVLYNGAVIGNAGGYTLPGVAGTKVGARDGTNWTTTTKVAYKAVSISVFPALNITSVTISPPALGQPAPTARIQGIYTGAIANVSVSIGNAANTVRLSDWTANQAVSGGAFDITVPVPSTAQGISAQFNVRDVADHTKGASYSQAVPVYQSVPATYGTNLGEYSAMRPFNDIFNMFGLYWNPGSGARAPSSYYDLNANYNADIGMTPDGKPTIVPTNGLKFVSDYDWPYNPASELYGTCSVEFTPGLIWTVTSNRGGAFTASNMNAAAGTATITNNHVAGPTTLAEITITGGLPADPADLYFHIWRPGITTAEKARLYRPSVRNFLAPFSSFRPMGEMRANRGNVNEIVHGIRQDNGFAWRIPGPRPAEIFTDMAIDGVAPYANIPDNWAPPAIRQFMQKLKTGVPSNLPIRGALSNETWNSGFTQYFALTRSVPNFTGGNLALVEGDYVKGNVSGVVAYVAKQRIKTGSLGGGNADGYLVLIDGKPYNAPNFTAGEALHKCNSAGTVITSNIAVYDATDNGQHIRHARACRWFFDLCIAEFGSEASRFIPVMEWQNAAGFSDMQAMLNEEDNWQIVKEFHLAPYGGAGIGDYTSTAYMSVASRDKAATDVAGFKADVIAAEQAALAVLLPAFQGKAASMAAYCVGKGLDKNAIAVGTYEEAPTHINGTTIWNWNFPALRFSGGNGSAVVAGQYLKGQTSGHIMQVQAPVLTGGSWAGSDAAGYFPAQSYNPYNTTQLEFTNGEILDRTDSAGVVLASAVATVASPYNLSKRASEALADLFRSADYGDHWANYVEHMLLYGGHHEVFIATGTGAVLSFFRGWGFWGTADFVDDPTQHAYVDIAALMP